ncbi:MAG: methyltransferase domain-containing protein [Acidobacteriota bacterium]|nr:methyltransferase domain-containing protein [Acidobacteriota bacterium]
MTSREHYTHGHHESVLRSHSWRTVANSAAYLEPHLTSGLSVLDVGCGPGTITAEIADRVGADGSVVGIDASADVVALASEAQQSTNLTFAVGDIYALEAADDTFDVVHAHQVMQHLADPVAALREMRRVCRPGGIVAARDADYSGSAWFPGDEWLDRWLDLSLTIGRDNGGEPDAGRRMLSWAQAAGFLDVTPSASVWCFATPSERSWWAGLWADRVMQSHLAEQAVAGGYATSADLSRMADAWRAWASHPDAWFAVIHGEILARA